MSQERPAGYVPALRFDALTPLFDALIRVPTRERAFKQGLLDQARLEGELDVLDLGSGTGTLAIWARQRNPRLRIRGVDGDPAIVERARRKAAKLGAAVEFDQGLSYELPYADASVDRVLSTLFFHHLVRADKLRTIAEIRRVLRPGGELHVADWGKPLSLPARVASTSIRLLDGADPTRDNLAGRLPELFEGGGLAGARERRRIATPIGIVSLYSASRPA